MGKDAGRQPDPQMFYLNRECGYTSDVLQVCAGIALECVEHGVRISTGNRFSLGNGLSKLGATFCAVVDWRHSA